MSHCALDIYLLMTLLWTWCLHLLSVSDSDSAPATAQIILLRRNSASHKNPLVSQCALGIYLLMTSCLSLSIWLSSGSDSGTGPANFPISDNQPNTNLAIHRHCTVDKSADHLLRTLHKWPLVVNPCLNIQHWSQLDLIMTQVSKFAN